jgi:aminopeptidase N
MRFIPLLSVGLAFVAGSLSHPSASGQNTISRPPFAGPAAHVAFAADGPSPGAAACRKSHLSRPGATAQRIASSSRDHERLMNRYDVTYCHLDIAVERTGTTLGTGSNVQTWARNRSATVALDTIGLELHPSLTLDSVQVNGVRVPTARIQRLTDGDIRVRPLTAVAPGVRFTWHAWYHGTPTPTGAAAIGDGITTANSGRWGNQVTWTLSQPFSAYEWWPCKQILSDKLDSVAVWVTTAADNKVGSNGILERVTPRPNGKARYEWKSRYPIDYYLVSVAVAQYIDYTTYAHPAGLSAADSIPIVNYVYNNPQTLPFWKADIDATASMIENYSAKFGVYPFWREKYGHSMAPLGGGMEHQTMTTQGTFDFTLTAHELFHQWFGDHVTCRSWRDIWLNEGFASYGEYLTLEALHPGTGDAAAWMSGAHQAALQQFTGSVAVPDTLDNNRIFDYNLTYQKGGSVVHMLRHVINNDSAFYASLATYQRQFADSVATTADLQHSLEGSLNQPLGWFFDQWISGEGFPRLDAGWNQVGSQLIFESIQTATAPGVTPFFRLPLEVRVTFSQAGVGPQTLRIEQLQATQRWTLPLPAGATVTRVELDPSAWNLMQVLRLRRNNALQPTGLTADQGVQQLSLWPNPCTEQLALPAAETARTAEVLDLAGRVVARQTLPPHADRLATAALASGVYVLRLTDAATGRTQQARFARQ